MEMFYSTYILIIQSFIKSLLRTLFRVFVSVLQTEPSHTFVLIHLLIVLILADFIPRHNLFTTNWARVSLCVSCVVSMCVCVSHVCDECLSLGFFVL